VVVWCLGSSKNCGKTVIIGGFALEIKSNYIFADNIFMGFL